MRRTLFVIAVWCLATPCVASQLLVPTSGTADAGLAGSTVAEPRTPSAAMFSNPAALSLFDRTTLDAYGGVPFGNTRVEAAAPSTYDESNAFITFAPGFGLSLPSKGSWSYGFAMYGAVGNKFDFDADPAAGVTSPFFSEAGIFTFAAGAAYQVNDSLSLGAAITPLFGLSRNKFTLGGVEFKYRLSGPGIQGLLGLQWQPCDGLALGLGVRTPGRVWMDATAPLAGGRQDVDLELEMPTQVFAGVSKHFGEKLIGSLAFRWTDASTLGDSIIEFEVTEAVNTPFVPDARDEWLASTGVEYLWNEILTLRLGALYATPIVGDKGVSPLLFDTRDIRATFGFSLNFDPWSIDFMTGYAFNGSRRIEADEALILPGRYEMDGPVVGLGVTWRH